MKYAQKLILLCGLFILLESSARSYLRPSDPNKPILTASNDEGKSFSIKSNYLEPYPLFTIRSDNLTQDILPSDEIEFQDKTGTVKGKELNYLIEGLLKEIQTSKKKKNFNHFTVLQSKNYNYKRKCGLLVLKFNDYPFVLKLFIETPETFCNPYIKGPEPVFFWYMGGGAGRHVAGLTRVKNLKNMKAMTELHPYWHDHIVFPRKWFWLPSNAHWITFQGTNLKEGEVLTNSIPGTFGVVADYINTENSYKMSRRAEQVMVMNYCNDMGLAVDPHHKNYSFQKHPTKDEPIMIIVDTEHFPTMVGLKEPKAFKSHGDWYRYLVNKGFNDIFMRTKKDHKESLAKSHQLALQELV